MEIYKAIKYIRLSYTDDKTVESDSVGNQRRMIDDFIAKHPEIEAVAEKIDDGYSGVLFDRPAFQEMIEMVKRGEANCIIVKDLSRLGRESIETGRYIRRFFPAYNVRFIAINDHFDTLQEDGAGCTVGTTMTICDKVVPNLVGVDIGCGMEVVKLREQHIELQKLDKVIHETVPSGFEKRKTIHKYADQIDLTQLRCAKSIRIDNALFSLGSLGGGNHFIEADKNENGNIYLVIHSGSRHLGLEVASFYQQEAYRQLTKTDRRYLQELRDSIISEYKAQGKEKELQNALQGIGVVQTTDVPKQFAYCSGYLFDDYIHDMKIVQAFATLNRQAIMDEILRGMKLHTIDQFTSVHNYIDTQAMILRKGATSAQNGERLIIPINMRDGSLICTGKGNQDWNCSAPHGAGRLMSRSEARASFTVSQMRKEMTGIYTTSVNQGTLDEAPMAYKPMDSIINNISETVEINEVIIPIYNFKAGRVDWNG